MPSRIQRQSDALLAFPIRATTSLKVRSVSEVSEVFMRELCP
jgi:hypothetical protein